MLIIIHSGTICLINICCSFIIQSVLASPASLYNVWVLLPIQVLVNWFFILHYRSLFCYLWFFMSMPLQQNIVYHVFLEGARGSKWILFCSLSVILNLFPFEGIYLLTAFTLQVWCMLLCYTSLIVEGNIHGLFQTTSLLFKENLSG